MDGLLINSVPSTGAPGAEYTFTPGHCPEVAGQGYQMQHISLDNYLDFDDTDLGVYRLVYSGFEVVNTTAQIHKQGAVTVYEYGNSYEVGASHPTRTDVEIVPGEPSAPYPDHRPTNYFRCPPNTLAEAKIMPGSHSWAAQDGCYNTAKFQTDNPFQGLTSRPWVICQNNVDGPKGSGYLQFDPVAQPSQYNSGSFASEFPLGFTGTINAGSPYRYLGGPVHFSRMNTTGAYFTGLSPETSLFVTWRVGIERLPAANKPAFLALSQPSAAYDPNALVLYNLVANALPPGCPQGYNDAGKWFRWIADQAKKAIPTVYPAVRTAALIANSMGRPVIGAALTGLANQLEGPAKKAAAQRIQAAARKQQQASKSGQRKPAVGNWSQPGPTPRPGGTNGLK